MWKSLFRRLRCSIHTFQTAIQWREYGALTVSMKKTVSMTATETLTTNARVAGGDPLVRYKKAEGDEPETVGGIGEEDMVTITLPYISSAREGVERLGMLLETYGTYEMNGIAFQDENEIWWLETIGGHNWIAKRVPDNEYVVMPNQLGTDSFDLEDAYGEKRKPYVFPRAEKADSGESSGRAYGFGGRV